MALNTEVSEKVALVGQAKRHAETSWREKFVAVETTRAEDRRQWDAELAGAKRREECY